MTIGIIGYGRFGQLWANVLANLDLTVLVYDEKTIQVDYDNIHSVNLETVVNCHFLFLAVPISEIENVCRKISGLVPSQTVVVDVASVKVHPASVMRRYLGTEQSIIATHPLFGPDSVARSGFAGHNIVVCPIRISETWAKKFESLLKMLQLNIIYTTPEDHDRQMARSQALVHFIGRGLEPLECKSQKISTPDYQSLLRMNSMVHHDTEQLFFDMQRYNPYTKDIRLKLLHSLQRLQRQIEENKHNM